MEKKIKIYNGLYKYKGYIIDRQDAGVDISQIMSVTGHTNIGSVQPYIKNTFTSANNALTTRTNHVKSILNADTESDTL